MINNIVIAGRLIADSELRNTTTGSAICNFTIANNRRTPTGGEETTYMEIVLFGKYAQSMYPYLKKGITVDVLGKLIQESWVTEGKNFHKYKIYAKEVDFRTPKTKNENYVDNYEGEYHE